MEIFFFYKKKIGEFHLILHLIILINYENDLPEVFKVFSLLKDTLPMMCVYIVCNARETNMLAVNEALRETSGE